MYYDELAQRVRFFKESKEGVAIMCKVMEDMRNESLREGIKEGRKEGKLESMRAAAERMLADGTLALEKISEYSGLSVEEVKLLRLKQTGSESGE